jgi:hypothetical protein
LEQEHFDDQLYADSCEIGLAGDTCDTSIHENFIFPCALKVVIVNGKKLARN